MKKLGILVGIFVLAGLLVGGWMVWKSQGHEETSNTKRQLTILPTTPVTNTPTPTIEITKSGNMFVNISAPADRLVVNAATVLVKGQTVANADVGVNDKDTVANVKGDFSMTVALDVGENEITVVATNEKGDFAEKTVMVTREQ